MGTGLLLKEAGDRSVCLTSNCRRYRRNRRCARAAFSPVDCHYCYCAVITGESQNKSPDPLRGSNGVNASSNCQDEQRVKCTTILSLTSTVPYQVCSADVKRLIATTTHSCLLQVSPLVACLQVLHGFSTEKHPCPPQIADAGGLVCRHSPTERTTEATTKKNGCDIYARRARSVCLHGEKSASKSDCISKASST